MRSREKEGIIFPLFPLECAIENHAIDRAIDGIREFSSMCKYQFPIIIVFPSERDFVHVASKNVFL